MCRMRKTTPTTMLALPTTRYAMPRNGFFPPSHDVVVMTNIFRPPNAVTGKAKKPAALSIDYSLWNTVFGIAELKVP